MNEQKGNRVENSKPLNLTRPRLSDSGNEDVMERKQLHCGIGSGKGNSNKE